MWETGYIMVLQVRLGAKIGDRHAKDSNAFRKRLILGARISKKTRQKPRDFHTCHYLDLKVSEAFFFI